MYVYTESVVFILGNQNEGYTESGSSVPSICVYIISSASDQNVVYKFSQVTLKMFMMTIEHLVSWYKSVIL